MKDPFNLERFVDAQEGIYAEVCSELRRGRKEGHWIWYIFPQLQGLGSSSTSNYYGIPGREEAAAYLAHPVLGPRLRECTAIVNSLEGRSGRQIFAWDDVKFRSSMTLFAAVAQPESIFHLALDKYFGGQGDALTLGRL